MSVTEDLFAETKGELGGFFVITAEVVDKVTQVMSPFPPASYGTAEMRPMLPVDTLKGE